MTWGVSGTRFEVNSGARFTLDGTITDRDTYEVHQFGVVSYQVWPSFDHQWTATIPTAIILENFNRLRVGEGAIKTIWDLKAPTFEGPEQEVEYVLRITPFDLAPRPGPGVVKHVWDNVGANATVSIKVIVKKATEEE